MGNGMQVFADLEAIVTSVVVCRCLRLYIADGKLLRISYQATITTGNNKTVRYQDKVEGQIEGI